MHVTDGGADFMQLNIKGEVVLKDLSCRADINAHELKRAINQFGFGLSAMLVKH
jgi:hypothetical protein